MQPKLLTCLKDYNKEQFLSDLRAGIAVGIVALPLCIAMAIASGASPEKGIITGIIGGFLVSLLGGSRVQIGGPTGALIIIVLGIITEHGLNGLIISTLMAGIIMILMGVFKLGDMIKFIPYPITTGFTSGLAVVIFSTQIKDFLGLNVGGVPSEFIEKWIFYIKNLQTFNLTALIIGIITILIIVFWPKVSKKIPGAFVSIILTTIIAITMNLDIPTIESQFGEIKGSIPMPSLPIISFELIKDLIMPAFAIAILGSITSLLSAVVADGMIGGRHRSNTELIAQGVANIASSLFGGIPITGAVARTTANVKNGGRTPVAGIVHSFTLLVMMLLLMPYIKYIPMSSLAGILIVVSYNMGEWEEFKELEKNAKSDDFIFLTTFILTIIFGIVTAIEVGMILAAFLFMKRMSDVTMCDYITSHEDNVSDDILFKEELPKGVDIYEINGPFFFGAADQFIKTLMRVEKSPKVLILKMKNVPTIDLTGNKALLRMHNIAKNNNTKIIITELQEETRKILEKSGIIEIFGKENIVENVENAIIQATVN